MFHRDIANGDEWHRGSSRVAELFCFCKLQVKMAKTASRDFVLIPVAEVCPNWKFSSAKKNSSMELTVI